MATRKVSNKRQVAKTKPAAGKSRPAEGPKAAAKAALSRAIAPRRAAVSISVKPAAVLAAEVEANIGGSRALTDFLKDIDWYK